MSPRPDDRRSNGYLSCFICTKAKFAKQQNEWSSALEHDAHCHTFYCWSKIYRSMTRAHCNTKRFFCFFHWWDREYWTDFCIGKSSSNDEALQCRKPSQASLQLVNLRKEEKRNERDRGAYGRSVVHCHCAGRKITTINSVSQLNLLGSSLREWSLSSSSGSFSMIIELSRVGWRRRRQQGTRGKGTLSFLINIIGKLKNGRWKKDMRFAILSSIRQACRLGKQRTERVYLG